jgi:methylated-DNA-[protein]-cysteine S-methyltransferase
VWRALLSIGCGHTTSYGALTGYAGGLERKSALLQLEGAALRPAQPPGEAKA